MRRFRLLYIGGAVVVVIAGYLMTARTGLHAQQNAQPWQSAPTISAEWSPAARDPRPASG